MSEYWKSIPKYWCKFCKAYVKDTKFEKQQHEATGRHQGNVKRALRGIHKEHDKEEREKQRAKDEVARVNGIVTGKPVASTDSPNAYKRLAQHAAAPKANAEERQKQMKQLADMGVSIPQDFRGDLAMAGEWQTVAVHPVNTKGDSKTDIKSFGVRKRKLEGEEEEEEEEESLATKRKGWGSTVRMHPSEEEGPEDIEALLKTGAGATDEMPPVKKEKDSEAPETTSEGFAGPALGDTKDENSAIAPIVFKKRKLKAART